MMLTNILTRLQAKTRTGSSQWDKNGYYFLTVYYAPGAVPIALCIGTHKTAELRAVIRRLRLKEVKGLICDHINIKLAQMEEWI